MLIRASINPTVTPSVLLRSSGSLVVFIDVAGKSFGIMINIDYVYSFTYKQLYKPP